MSAYTFGDLDRYQQPQASDSNLSNPAEWLVDWYRGGMNTDSGVAVNGRTILTSGPIFQAVSIISGDLGQLPLRVMARQPNGDATRDRIHPAHKLFSRQPNDDMLPSTFKELLQQWALLWGNGVAAIMRTGSRPTQLVPLLPDRTTVERDEAGQLWYLTKINDGMEQRRFHPDNVLHIPSLTSDGLWGLSTIALMKNAAGLDMSLEKHGNLTFAKGTRLSGVLTRPVDAGKWTKDARQNLRREWSEMHEGLDAKEAVAVLQDGMDFKPMSVSIADSDWVNATKLSREKIAEWFNLPPHKLGAMQESAVRANLEEQNLDYLNTTLMRWLNKWQEECNRKLLTTREQETESRFFKWNTAALLRGSLKARYEAYAIGRTNEWLSANDVLRLEDMNQRDDPGGDEYKNPNTSSSAAAAPPPVEEEEDTPPALGAAHRALMTDSARRLLETERHRVRKAAKGNGNFLNWANEFYDGFGNLAGQYLSLPAASLAAQSVRVSDPAIAALTHGRASHKQLVDLAGVVEPAQLEAQVGQLTEQWPDRAAAMVDAILGGQTDVKAI